VQKKRASCSELPILARQNQCRMKSNLLFLFNSITALAFCAALQAQTGIAPAAGARGIGMGNTGVVFTDVHSALSNQAGLGMLDRPAALVFGEQRFLLAELRSLGAAYAMPVSGGAFAVSVQYFGMKEYNEQRFGLAYGRQIFPGTSIGAQINVFTTRIPGYGNTLTLNAEIGLQTRLLPKLLLGLHVANPVQTVTRGGDRLPTLLRTGLAYESSDKLLVVFELEKDIDFPLRAKTGFEYRPHEQVFLRLGASTQPASASLGAGYTLPGGLAFDFAAAWHSYLGITPAFGLTYSKPIKK